MKLKNIPRILALLTALFFVPLLLSGGTLRSAETSPLSGQQMQYAVSECDVYAQTSIVSAQELLPANTVRITRCSSTKSGQQPGIVYIILLSFLLAAAVCILYLTVRRTDRDIGRIRRFIIKYIHDKDGHKSSPFVLLLKNIENDTTEVLFYDEYCYNSFGCSAAGWHAASGLFHFTRTERSLSRRQKRQG